VAISSGESDAEPSGSTQYKPLFQGPAKSSGKRKFVEVTPPPVTELRPAKVVINREAGTVSVEMPLSPETEAIAQQICEEYTARL
jgi:hypothetical protein